MKFTVYTNYSLNKREKSISGFNGKINEDCTTQNHILKE